MRLLVLASALIARAGCSSVDTQKATVPLSTINASERFQVMVRTGNAVMDKLVYEMAFRQFGGLLPLKEKEPFTGVLEITFASSDQSWFIGTSTTTGATTAQGAGWYTGILKAAAEAQGAAKEVTFKPTETK